MVVSAGLTTSQNDAAPKPEDGGGRRPHRLTTSQNDAAPKQREPDEHRHRGLTTSQNDAAPKRHAGWPARAPV